MSYLAIFEEDHQTASKRKAVQAKLATDRNLKTASQHDLEMRDALFEVVRVAYMRSKVYPNCNKTTIAIKVDRPNAADKLDSSTNKELNAFITKHSVHVRKLGTSIIYHLDRTDDC
jgi:hypothetical protein